LRCRYAVRGPEAPQKSRAFAQGGNLCVTLDHGFDDAPALGVPAGIDTALWLAGQLHEPDYARSIQRAIEYEPAPPYTADV
jgi:hypothetical protein